LYPYDQFCFSKLLFEKVATNLPEKNFQAGARIMSGGALGSILTRGFMAKKSDPLFLPAILSEV